MQTYKCIGDRHRTPPAKRHPGAYLGGEPDHRAFSPCHWPGENCALQHQGKNEHAGILIWTPPPWLQHYAQTLNVYNGVAAP